MKRGLRVMLMPSLALLFLFHDTAAQNRVAGHDDKVTADNHGQQVTKPVALPLKTLLQQVEEHFRVSVAYKSNLVKDRQAQVTVAACKSPEEALQQILSAFNLRYEKVRDRFYMITEKQPAAAPASATSPVQQHPVKGLVKDDKGNIVAGVTVKVTGTSIGTVTGPDGVYTLTVPGKSDDQLEVSFIGYETQRIVVGGRSLINITLKEGASALNEIVVTGYATQKKKDLTGAVTVVNIDNLIKQPTAQVTEQLQGQASGVTVIGSGSPGASPQIRIRGVNTFGSNSPLYVVDGVPTTDIADLNPNDVASLQVLKDAGAASIYGARASNGVIIITTRRGKGKIAVTYDGYYGRQYPKNGNVWHTLNPQEQADLRWLAYKNSGGDPGTALYGHGDKPVIPDYILPSGAMEGDPATDPSLYYLNPNYTDLHDYERFYQIARANKGGTDWFHEIFRPAPVTSHNVAVSGGSDRGNYLFSLNYFNQQGTLINTYLKRYTVRSNTQYNITDHIRVGENLAFSMTDNPAAEILTSDAPIGHAMRSQSIIPVYDIKGNFAGSAGDALGDANNPVAIQERTRNNKGLNTRLFGNIYGEVDFLKYLTFRTSFGGEIYSGWSHSFDYPMYENKENSTSNSYSESANNGHNWTWTNTLAFRKNFNQVHDLKVLVGTEAFDSRSRSVGGTTKDYFTFDAYFPDLSTGTGTQTNYSNREQESLYSLLGRVDYAFKDKYLLSATIRRDGSSKFLVNRFGWFPAVTAGWRISQETFMKQLTWITDLKLRGGWGIMGNQMNLSVNNGYFLYGGHRSSTYYDLAGRNNELTAGFAGIQIGNPDAKWESDVNANIGIDASLFNGQLDFAIDYYRKDIKDLLYNPELPGLAGTAKQPFVNIAQMKNEGWDFTVGWHKELNRNLKLNVTGTLTTYKNKILKISDGVEYFDGDGRRFEGSNIIRNAVGQPVSSFFGYKIIGFWNETAEITAADDAVKKATNNPDAFYQEGAGLGRFRYADVNGDGQITPDDRTFLGNPNPDFSYGINLGVTWKAFDFSIFLYGVQGNEIWNNVRWWRDFYAAFGSAKSKTALYDSWTPERKNAKAPIQEVEGSNSTMNVPNSYMVENGAYLRAKNMQIGYTLPAAWISRLKVQKLRVYVQAANLFTITKYSGIDPEIGGSDITDFGVDEGAYPNQRQFLVGVNLGF
ncbi:SusC/RagA family TonB-linked outer membrane protein [Chitinophaga nivalis]|uniref:SusC/RagA family TonB-linked outer membrane protein n=1 Tax=Chitinophaga nivalis TaxID=2991709 RepID=A0ABT3IIX7_9BACT|nr:SusC/RagA family TonB-linked outer membrane protein [Chitinophaga nivalis]MCW3466610.1 SusC/RagA family TonB-linked outer membrane protein [Chitinophaga nivalis]MCW3483699.1 SusC/RagA family TonB-linked outer membrane protein [Chitinophaga nivalis]